MGLVDIQQTQCLLWRSYLLIIRATESKSPVLRD